MESDGGTLTIVAGMWCRGGEVWSVFSMEVASYGSP